MRSTTEWRHGLDNYVASVNLQLSDSEYLREHGLKPIMRDLIGDVSEKSVLDLGSADGWVCRETNPMNHVNLDLARPPNEPREFVAGDAAALPIRSSAFDVATASLSLMWMRDIEPVFKDVARVLKPGGRFIAALVNPHFYRTGVALDDGSYLIERDVSDYVKMDVMIAQRTQPFDFYRRPFNAYLNAGSDNGLCLTQAKDWHIDVADFEASVPDHLRRIKRSGNVPCYTFLAWEKAA